MAENFDLIFGQNASQQYAWSDNDYQNGWETIGNIPPTAAQFDALQRRSDTKMKELNDELTPLVNANTTDNRQPATEYSEGTIKYTPLLPTGWFLECTVAGVTDTGEIVLPTPPAEKDTVADGTVTWTIRKMGSGSGGDGFAIGDIKAIAYNGTVQQGWLLCDGRAVSRSMFPDLFDVIGTTYGAGDGSTTFNVPDYNSAKRFAQGDTVAGQVKEAGLPNITGDINGGSYHAFVGASGTTPPTTTGALSIYDFVYKNKISQGQGYSDNNFDLSFDASRASSIYGNSTTVQPPALTARFIIKAYDGVTPTPAEADISEMLTELTGKADRDLDNLSAAGEAKIASLVTDTVKMPDWSNTIAITNTAGGFVYQPPVDGYIKVNVSNAAASSNCYIFLGTDNTGIPLNSTVGSKLYAATTQAGADGIFTNLIPVESGESYYIVIANISYIQVNFVPFKS